MIDWRQTKVCTALVLSITVSGCFLFPKDEDKKIAYKSAAKLPPLEIPPDLVTPQTDERYIIPGQSPGSTTFSQYKRMAGNRSGAQLDLLPGSEKEGISIQRAGTQRWLVVPQAPEVVWPVIKEFWQDLGFLIKTETPETGVLETDWAENRAKVPEDLVNNTFSLFSSDVYATTERDKFRTRLERTDDGATEIYISHRGMDEIIEDDSKGKPVWQPRPADPNLEAEMLTRLMIHFGIREEQAQLALTTTRNGSQERALLETSLGENTLIVYEAFDRAWRRVGLALDRVGFTVEDRNRLDGIYFVRYANPAEGETYRVSDKPGILKDLMFWKSSDAEGEKANKYRIQVREISLDSSRIAVLGSLDETAPADAETPPVDPAAANRMLELLYEQLK